MSDMSDRHGFDDFDGSGDGPPDGEFPADDWDCGLLEEELRQAAEILDPVPAGLRGIAVDAFALHDLDARVAELTFDSLVDGIPVRGESDPPRMLTFQADAVTVDVEVTEDGLIGQLLPPGPARIEVLSGPREYARLTADDLGRFTGEAPPSGPFALRLRTGREVVVTEWLRA
ncbi:MULTISPECIES: hypothetical protein [Streptomyces]|uniref:hypothetical protein n=1 Tax=Streptomyces TaxID=1883 RepID=UPI00039D712C|nr:MULTISPECIES: hypothetical protein [Streptomyces]MBZ6109394.1 hypothetical protein [Streptomyces olivaceus]MBZ6123679.1 hypothetical protein [Streptomyces olivaceus]MBZ6143787.1 hypothetical protein [Streptomyces olivaceus]MBZ6157627.1 hypothetical protein [Streptomyces olivaceus]MBZ6185423.1 hypothetical protein [Streptomyces olivaceus]